MASVCALFVLHVMYCVLYTGPIKVLHFGTFLVVIVTLKAKTWINGGQLYLKYLDDW